MEQKNVKRKIIALLVLFCMALEMFGVPVLAANNGPSSGEMSAAWVQLIQGNTSQVLYSSGGKSDKVEGAAYDKSTNTITLTNYNHPDTSLNTNEMGDDLKLRLVGKNSISALVVWGFGWGGNLEIIGDGSLTINENKKSSVAIQFMAEGTAGTLKVGHTATVTAYKMPDAPGINTYSAEFIATTSKTIPFSGNLETKLALTPGSGVEGERELTENVVTEARYAAKTWQVATKGNDGKKYGIEFGSVGFGEYEKKYAWIYELVKVDGLSSGNQYLANEVEGIEGCQAWPSEYTVTEERIVAKKAEIDTMRVLKKGGETFYWGQDEIKFPPEGGAGMPWYSVYKALGVEMTAKDFGSTKFCAKVVSPVEGMRNITDDVQAIPKGYETTIVKTGLYNYFCTNDVIKVTPSSTSAKPDDSNTIKDTPDSGTVKIDNETVIYKDGKLVTGSKLVTVSGKTYAVVKGRVKT